jgi:sulfur carrier protein
MKYPRLWLTRRYRDVYAPGMPRSEAIMKIILPDQEVRVREGAPATVRDLLTELGIHPLEVIVAKNGVLVPEQAPLGSNDEIRIIRIAHGG